MLRKMRSPLFLLALIAAVLLGCAVAMRKQGVAVKGKLICGNSPLNSTKVRIVDIDSGPDPDDTLEEKMVGPTGEFTLNGYTRELTPIDPVLYIWTTCDRAGAPCHRKIKFIIPKKYIISEEPKAATEWINVGTINLQSVFENEKRECIS